MRSNRTITILISQLPSCSLFYRAVLQVILIDMTGDERVDWQVGKIAAKCSGFTDYVRKSMKKLNIECTVSHYVINLY